ncbi:MAG: serine/threonine-protein kinase [Myxococcota bacterium]
MPADPSDDSSAALRAAGGEAGRPGEDFARHQALERLMSRITGQPMPPLLDRFELVKRLGSGSHGQVYEALDLRLDRRVAIKMITDPGHRALDEARALAQVDAPGVIQIHELIEEATVTVVVMPFVEGGTIDAWAAAQTRPWRSVVEVGLQVAIALDAVHRADVVHGDVKPSNILVDGAGQAVLIDFSLAGRAQQEGASPAGTPRFMAPEAHTAAPTAQSDQYSFFKTLQALLGGSDDRSEVSFPDALGLVLERGLKADPAQRFESMAAARRAITEVLHRRRRWAVRIAVVSVVLLALAATTISGVRASRCDAQASLDEVWSDEIRRSVEEGELPEGVLPGALTTRLDDTAAAFESTAKTQCRAGSVWSPTPPPLSMCLEDARRRIAFVAAGLREDPTSSLAQAEALGALLGDPTGCEGTDTVAEVRLAPDDDVEAFLATRAELRRIALVMETDPAAATLALKALQRTPGVSSCAWRPEALLIAARHESLNGQPDAAASASIEAAAEAEACRRPEAELRARTEATTQLATAGRNDDADNWLSMSAATLRRTPTLANHAWRVDAARGWLAYLRGEHDIAADAYTSVESAAAAAGRAHTEATSKRIAILSIRGDPEAISLAQALLDQQRATFGPAHPNVARALGFLGFARSGQGQLEEATAAHRRALAIWDQWPGAFPRDRVQTLRELSGALQASHPLEAIAYLKEFIAFYEANLPRNATRGEAMAILAMSLRALDRNEEALQTAIAGLEVLAELTGPDSPQSLQLEAMTGRLRYESGEVERGAKVACGAMRRFAKGGYAGLTAAGGMFLACLDAAQQLAQDGQDVATLLDPAWVRSALAACPRPAECDEARSIYARIVGEPFPDSG